ncbi:MAG: FtsH protease activity modulator HflK [Verrucomicrobia bacterium]|nr:FtsH protease activity modulator HflK [Verrucomicrobiota bacterium]
MFDVNGPWQQFMMFRRAIILAVLILIPVGIFYSSFYTVGPEEEAIVLTFGKHTSTVGPGAHFKWPFGIQAVYKFPVKRQLKEEFGFRTAESFNSRGPSTYMQDLRAEAPKLVGSFLSSYHRYGSSAQDMKAESVMLTGDLNLVEVEWVAQSHVSDIRQCLFQTREPMETFRDANIAVMRKLVGDRTMSEVVTTGRSEIENQAKIELQALCKNYGLGITVDQVILQDVAPPEKVQFAFKEVNQAQQERESMINQAEREYNKVIPEAKGQAQGMIKQAEGYAADRTNRAYGDVAKFNALLAEYKKAPEVTRNRLYLEAMETILPQAGKKLVVDSSVPNLIPLVNDTAAEKVKPSEKNADQIR